MAFKRLIQFAAFLLVSVANKAHSGVLDYFSNYEAGVALANEPSGATLRYERPELNQDIPSHCKKLSENDSHWNCTISFQNEGSGAYRLRPFLQQPFKREGFFHFQPDVGFGFYYANSDFSESDASDRLITKASVDIYALLTTLYVQFGVTPKSFFPDLLISIGFGLLTGTGEISVEEQKSKLNVNQSFLYLEYELVWWRYGRGALSTGLLINQSLRDTIVSDVEIADVSNLGLANGSASFYPVKWVFSR